MSGKKSTHHLHPPSLIFYSNNRSNLGNPGKTTLLSERTSCPASHNGGTVSTCIQNKTASTTSKQAANCLSVFTKPNSWQDLKEQSGYRCQMTGQPESSAELGENKAGLRKWTSGNFVGGQHNETCEVDLLFAGKYIGDKIERDGENECSHKSTFKTPERTHIHQNSNNQPCLDNRNDISLEQNKKVSTSHAQTVCKSKAAEKGSHLPMNPVQNAHSNGAKIDHSSKNFKLSKNDLIYDLKTTSGFSMTNQSSHVLGNSEQECHSPICTLDICLQIGKCLENELLPKLFEARFDGFNIHLSYETSLLFLKKNITQCHFSITGDNIAITEESLTTVVNNLRKELNVQISYDDTKKSASAFTNDRKSSTTKISSKPNSNHKGTAKCHKGDSEQNTMSQQKSEKMNTNEEQAALKSEIQQALSSIENRIKKILENHETKTKEIQLKIEEYSKKEDFDFISEKEVEAKNVLLQKLDELQMQRTEFVQHCEKLRKDLKTLDTLKATSSNVSSVLKSVGIECTRLKNALPIYAKRKDIVNQMKSHQVSIILGETGSGKSTQLAQYLYEAGLAKHGLIVCTQPRKIAAVTLAERVANEMVDSIGKLVGYKAGTPKKIGQETKIVFTTDHFLLTECLKDRDLKNYSCIIVDEAHERSIYTDILLGIIKRCLQKRPDLKVIITSATIDPGVFVKYFNSGPELRVSGRTFPVDLFYTEGAPDDFENYEEKAVSKAVEIHSSKGPGDILVFLTSPVEIMRCCEEFEKRCKGKTNFACLPLHGQLPSEDQKKVFEKLSNDKRKVIFATNCAETSITIDGIMYVIDTGVAKEMKYDPKRNMNQLGTHAISKSSADQRKGRAGRTASGTCYRLYSKDSFEAMESINDPEILRVHLGQAVLKLFELGIDVNSYDFVQAPSETALNSAIETLEYLGAIVNNHITDNGRWISKLPFDPKLGYLVYEAEKKNLLYDAVVLASVISSGSDLFFRGFTESEAQVVAKSKIDFGSEYGDTFTWLQVYRAWSGVTDDKKSSWCRTHCISYKSINFVRQSIKDAKTLLSRDLGIDMRQQFSTEANAMDKLRKILFNAHAASISNFSQLSKAGYFSLIPERQVHVHPSSILVALNLHPEWLVYTNLMRTSREFIKGITVVEEEWVHELVTSGKLKFDITKAEQNKFYSVHREEVGSTIFHALVGPCFSNLRVLEEKLLNSGLLRSVIEASRDLGVLDVHSPFAISQSAVDIFNEIKSTTTNELLSDDFEFALNKKESIVSSGTRVVIGHGGCVKNILMPNQSDKVMVKRTHQTVTEEEILEKFSVFGEIKEIIQFKSYDPWGFVRFGSVAEALSAVEATSKDKSNAGILKLDKHARHGKNMFEAKLTWIRRPIKGSGAAYINCSPLNQSSLAGQSIWVNEHYRTIKVAKRGDLVIYDTGSLNENEVKDLVINLMYGDIDMTDIKVTVAREAVDVSMDNINAKAHEVTSFIKRYLNEDSFKISMLKPKGGSIYYVCFISFTDPVRGYKVCRKMNHRLLIDGQVVEVNPCLKTIVHVQRRLKEACEQRFKTLFKGLAKYKATELTWKELKKDFAIEIKSSTPSNIIEARDLLCKELEGEIIDCSINEILSCLLNKVGQECLKKIEKNNSCVIITDFRSGKIHIYGPESKVSKTQQDINSYLSEIEGSDQGSIQMKGHDKPPGLMKLTMCKYGPLLNGLVEEFKLKSIKINWKKQSVHLIGTTSAVEKACQTLVALETEAWKDTGQHKETSLPDCQVCMCPIEKKEMLFRLEVCGHAYCLDCFQNQVSFSVDNKEFPLTCAGSGCDSCFVYKDIRFALSKKWIREDKLVSMAVNAFVTLNKDQYKFCLTPNCPVVYKVTDDIDGCEFNCPLCFASICTSCHIAFHAGMTCLMAKSGTQAESVLANWVAANPSKRKLCPGCRCPIEKIKGCNNMHCSSCRTLFCWLCLEVSQTEDACYKHLRNVHNGYY